VSATTNEPPAVFNTLTGDDWKRSLIAARKWRQDAIGRIHERIKKANLEQLKAKTK